MRRKGVHGWGFQRVRPAALAAALGCFAAGCATTQPKSDAPAVEAPAAVEAKAYDFLSDTKLSEADRRATARDLATLCAAGRIKGC